jgi:hypothetical protein
MKAKRQRVAVNPSDWDEFQTSFIDKFQIYTYLAIGLELDTPVLEALNATCLFFNELVSRELFHQELLKAMTGRDKRTKDKPVDRKIDNVFMNTSDTHLDILVQGDCYRWCRGRKFSIGTRFGGYPIRWITQLNSLSEFKKRVRERIQQ